MQETLRILLAEDEEIIAIVISDLLNELGIDVIHCNDGASAWDRLKNDNHFDAILLDRVMPGMDGMELLKKIKSDPSLEHIPVIMETALADKASVKEGIDYGAYYYLTKPFEREVLLAVVKSALQQSFDRKEMLLRLENAERPLAFMDEGTFHIRDLEQAEMLAHYLALACPRPERSYPGLLELLLNAIEHGNLELGYSEKSKQLQQGSWKEEIQRRLQLDAYRNRRVEIKMQRTEQSLIFTITDEGNGFDWEQFLEFSTDRAYDLHGRGIAMANKLSFDRLKYQGSGNVVVAEVLNNQSAWAVF